MMNQVLIYFTCQVYSLKQGNITDPSHEGITSHTKAQLHADIEPKKLFSHLSQVELEPGTFRATLIEFGWAHLPTQPPQLVTQFS